MTRVDVDESRAPLIVVTYPPAVTEQEFRDLFARYVELSRRLPRVAYLIDFRHFNPLFVSPRQRQEAAQLFAENRHTLTHATVCEARVVASPVARGILTAFDWLTGSKWPCRNFETFAEAERWIAEQLAGPPPSSGRPRSRR
jgi:hypothetical protein